MRVSLKTAPTIEPIVSEERELKRPRRSGIYEILCKPNSKVYIGSAVWLAKRKRHHREALLAGTHYNKYLQKAWNKYGPTAFVFSVLEYCEKERLIEREQYYIDTLQAADHGYGFNLQPKAYSNLGMIMSEESRLKLSAAKKGRPCSLSSIQIEQLRERMRGNLFSVGMKHTPETRERMKLKRKGKRPALGMRHTEEAKKKMSEARKGVKLSVAHREKIAASHKGKKQSKEHRRKLALIQSKIKPILFPKIKEEYDKGIVTMKDLAMRYGCCAQTICNIINNKRMVC